VRQPHTIPAQVRELQRSVSNPGISAWVAANAGSGKTHVLVQRVINLLLDGVEPEKILCITFTKAAAANMAKRVFDKLAEWTTLDDAALDEAIREESLTPPDPRRRALARKLFARALETPGGLKVQTIHAFCTQLLHQFPFEANVVARFTVLDETEHTQLLEQLTLAALLQGAAAPDSALGRALATAMVAAADQTFRDVVREAIGQRDAIVRWVGDGGVDAAIARLSKTLGVAPSDSVEGIEAQFFSAALIAQSEWQGLSKTLSQGSKTDGEQARRFGSLAALDGFERLAAYQQIFCTGDGARRKSIVTKAIKDKDPTLAERLGAEQERICALLEKRRAAIYRDRSAALVTVAHEVLSRYQNEKQRRGLLDYDDLIDKTLELLSNVDAAWVHYKLDLGINHLLIDEAQDTSRKQWDIVQRLVAEFAAGAGARDVMRTIFAVGDEKQSIYSFQDAAPKEFAEIGRVFLKAHTDAALEFIICQLKHSFRSGANILAAVDEVFKSPAMTASVASVEGEIPPHIALEDTPPGVVEIWEPEKPDPPREIEPWQAPFDTVSETSPRVKLAQRIARAVRRIVDGREAVGMDHHAARYGDILVLVRQRGALFEAIIRALKNENVDVAGADRLVLAEHIAVMDLMALADALLLPQDDLALATVLRSPLFGFSDDDLFTIAWDRGALSLRAALAKKADERQIFAAAAVQLDALAAAARRETPFAFFAGVLGAGGGRKRFLARLGPEVNDALDEFLNLALDYERSQTPSLQGFVAWLREARAEVRRDMEIARDEVRVMTVHGAKGLEAPIVILADTMTPPMGPRPPRLLELASGPVIWAGRTADDVPSVSDARNKARSEAENEYRRLLYVAMTRAADRLIVCGADGTRARPKGCWYDLIRAALETSLAKEDDNGETIFRYGKVPFAPQRAAPASNEKHAGPVPPAWLRQSAPAEAPRPLTVSPSSAFEDDNGHAMQQATSAADRQKALTRGRLVHRLMQALPDIASDRRTDAATRFLATAADDFEPAEQTEMVQKILAILDNKNFAEIFAPGSRAELPIVGRFARPGAPPIHVSGQVDRLAVTGDAVLIADYKTDRVVPESLADAQPYVTQLALYRAVLQRLYPGKTVRAALLFTEMPRLMEVPAADMDAALAALVAKAHAAVKVP
jgi:ATP-dependent helicase/nuclease subunit A